MEEKVLLETNFPDLKLIKKGKVRDIYDLGEYLLLVTTDRISAFDVVLPKDIPGKGKVLNQISVFWFNKLADVAPNHITTADIKMYPAVCQPYADQLEGRSMLVKKVVPATVECIIRGYLSGSGWKSYQKEGTVCGIKLPEGLVESQEIPGGPIFTPSTKEEEGHDRNISFEEMCDIVGDAKAFWMREVSLALYDKAAAHAEKRGIIIADTKFEFGEDKDSHLIFIDEALTPDSSRFWSKEAYQPGRSQDSYDKQIVRDYLLTLDWDKTYPGPVLPEEIIQKTAQRYQEILRILTV